MEIKFRGKRIDNGEWIEGYYGKLENFKEKHYIMQQTITFGYSTNIYFTDHEVEPESVGQYTGLEDNSETNLYYGDIVEIYYGGRKDQTKLIDTVGDLVYLITCIDEHGAAFDIIGDKHINPELLEGDHD